MDSFEEKKVKNEQFWACMQKENNTVTCYVTRAMGRVYNVHNTYSRTFQVYCIVLDLFFKTPKRSTGSTFTFRVMTVRVEIKRKFCLNSIRHGP